MGKTISEKIMSMHSGKEVCAGDIVVADVDYGEKLYIDLDEESVGDAERIKDFKEHSPNLEYLVKLRKVEERLYTDEAKRIAKGRIEFMDAFFDRLKEEVKGNL